MTRRALLLSVLCAGAFLGAIDVQLVNVAFPDMLRSFPGSDLAGLSWVFNGYTITYTAALLPAGGLADRFGHRRVYVCGLAVFVAAAGACAVAPSAGVLILARLVQGAGGGVITPLSLALILPEFAADRRGTAVALWGAAQSAAIASGPSLGGLLVGSWGWRTVFLLHLPTGLGVLAGAWRMLPADRPAGQDGLPDLPGLALLVCGIGLPSLAIVQASAWRPELWGVTLTAGVTAGGLFVRRIMRHPAPIIDLGVLRVRETRQANLAMFALGLVMFGWTLGNVLFLTRVWGYSETQAGLALTPGPIAQVLVAPLSAKLTRRWGHRDVALAGVALFAGAALLAAVAATGRPAYLAVMLPALLAAGAGIALQVTALSGAAVADVPAAQLATGTALSVTARAGGAVIGVSAVVLALSQHGLLQAHQEVWYAMLTLCGVTAALVLGLRRRDFEKASLGSRV